VSFAAAIGIFVGLLAATAIALWVRRRLGRRAAWTSAAGAEFARISEAARCDLVFAVASLDDERSLRMLEGALDDPSETVALAAAHALNGRECGALVAHYLAAHRGERARRIAATLELLA
jgi:hypothetical protein